MPILLPPYIAGAAHTAAAKHIYLYADALRTFVYFCHSDLSCIDHFSNVSVNVAGDARPRVPLLRAGVENLGREKKKKKKKIRRRSVKTRDGGCTCGIRSELRDLPLIKPLGSTHL